MSKKIIEIDDFCKVKYPSNIKYSPDGKKACFVLRSIDQKKDKYVSNLWIIEGKRTRQLTSGGKENDFVWADNNTILFIGDREESSEPSLESKVYSIRTDGGEAVLKYTIPIPVRSIIPMKNGDLIITGTVFPGYENMYTGDTKISSRYQKDKKENEDYEIITQSPWWWNGGTFTRRSYSALFVYLSKNGKLTRISPEGMSASDVKLDKEEKSIYYTLLDVSVPYPYHFRGQTIYKTDLSDYTTKKFLSSKKDFVVRTYELCDDYIVVTADDARHGINTDSDFYKINYSGRGIKLFAKHSESIGSSVGTDVRYGGGRRIKSRGNNVYFISTIFNSANLYVLDETGKITRLTSKEGSVDLFDINCEGEIIYTAFYDMKLPEIYSLNEKPLTSFNRAYSNSHSIIKPETFIFNSGDHLVHGFILKPSGYEPGQKYPAILDIHGGPKTVYGPVFYHEMQYWANHGYFVIYCNPTGSDGRGPFMDIRGKYGTVDYDDIMNFCDEVLKSYPDIDKNNMFETGGSYGGFMTNWIIGHTNRFRACASQRSISNWFSMSCISDIGYVFAEDQTLGNIWETPEKVWFHSPLKYADRCKTPTLFIHSFEDYRCPIDQGYQMFSSLIKNGVESKMVLFKGENHELSRSGKPTHRIKRLTEIFNWFEVHKKQ